MTIALFFRINHRPLAVALEQVAVDLPHFVGAIDRGHIQHGDQLALDLSVEGGEVVWFDHELLPNEDDNNFPPDDGMERLGLTFGQFLAALAPPGSPAPKDGFLDRLRGLIGRRPG